MKASKARILFAVLLLVPLFAHAEIEQIAVPANKGVRAYWWPKLQAPAGWQHDRHHSLVYGANALVPTGDDFEHAAAVMYAKALYKPRELKYPTLAALMESDRADFEKHIPGVRIEERDALVTADGQTLRSFAFIPPNEDIKEANWERVAYGEEGDFYLVFTLSAHTRAAYEAAMEAYAQLIRSYRK